MRRRSAARGTSSACGSGATSPPPSTRGSSWSCARPFRRRCAARWWRCSCAARSARSTCGATPRRSGRRAATSWVAPWSMGPEGRAKRAGFNAWVEHCRVTRFRLRCVLAIVHRGLRAALNTWADRSLGFHRVTSTLHRAGQAMRKRHLRRALNAWPRTDNTHRVAAARGSRARRGAAAWRAPVAPTARRRREVAPCRLPRQGEAPRVALRLCRLGRVGDGARRRAAHDAPRAPRGSGATSTPPSSRSASTPPPRATPRRRCGGRSSWRQRERAAAGDVAGEGGGGVRRLHVMERGRQGRRRRPRAAGMRFGRTAPPPSSATPRSPSAAASCSAGSTRASAAPSDVARDGGGSGAARCSCASPAAGCCAKWAAFYAWTDAAAARAAAERTLHAAASAWLRGGLAKAYRSWAASTAAWSGRPMRVPTRAGARGARWWRCGGCGATTLRCANAFAPSRSAGAAAGGERGVSWRGRGAAPQLCVRSSGCATPSARVRGRGGQPGRALVCGGRARGKGRHPLPQGGAAGGERPLRSVC